MSAILYHAEDSDNTRSPCRFEVQVLPIASLLFFSSLRFSLFPNSSLLIVLIFRLPFCYRGLSCCWMTFSWQYSFSSWLVVLYRQNLCKHSFSVTNRNGPKSHLVGQQPSVTIVLTVPFPFLSDPLLCVPRNSCFLS